MVMDCLVNKLTYFIKYTKLPCTKNKKHKGVLFPKFCYCSQSLHTCTPIDVCVDGEVHKCSLLDKDTIFAVDFKSVIVIDVQTFSFYSRGFTKILH